MEFSTRQQGRDSTASHLLAAPNFSRGTKMSPSRHTAGIDRLARRHETPGQQWVRSRTELTSTARWEVVCEKG